MPGTVVTTDSVAVETGLYTVIVTTSNAAGTGPSASVRGYIGFDTPQTPANVQLVNEGTTMTVTWDAVTASKNNGWFDAANIKYNVVRQPEAVKVAEGIAETTLTDVLTNAELRGYWYEVTAVNGTAVSEAGVSNTVTSGTYVAPPFFEDFKRENSLALFTVEDANYDGNTWQLNSWSPIAEYVGGEAEANDWLITPPIKLSAGEYYRLSFNTLTFSDSDCHVISVAMGSANNHEDLTEILIPATEQSGNETHVNETVVSVEEDGIYFFGIHVGGRPYQYMLQLTDLSIKSIASKDAPAAPAFAVTAGAQGALSASYTVTVNGLNGNGEAIEAVSKIEVARDGQVIATIENPVVGTEYTGEDTDVAEGLHRYTAVAYADGKNGLEGVTSVFVGEDAPMAPANIRTEVKEDSIVVSWDAATVGQHGGYVNPEKVTYTVVTSNEVALVKGYTSTTYTDTPEMGGDQRLMGYGVFASNDKGNSQITLSDPILLGDPYALPYVESFPGGEVSSFIGIASTGNAGFSTSTDTSYDGDGGSVMFTSFEPGTEGTFYTGKISMAGSTHPELRFQVATVNNFDEKLFVDVLTASGQKKTIAAYDINTIQTGVWLTAQLNLTDFKDEPYIQLYFRVQNVSEPAASIYMDRIMVSNTSGLDAIGLDKASQEIYDLSGRQLGTDRSSLAPGIYIIGGSKVVVK